MSDLKWSERIDQAVQGSEVAEYLAAIRDNNKELASRLEAVENLHYPVEIEPLSTICGHCSVGTGVFFAKMVEWPCDTMKAARGE